MKQETREFKTNIGGNITKSILNGKKNSLKGDILITFNNNKTGTVGISLSFTNPRFTTACIFYFFHVFLKNNNNNNNHLLAIYFTGVLEIPCTIIHAMGIMKKKHIIGKAILLNNDNSKKMGTFVSCDR